MIIRNGQALGSVLHRADPKAARPTTGKKRGRPRKTVDERTDTEREADENAAQARADIAKNTVKERADGGDDKNN